MLEFLIQRLIIYVMFQLALLWFRYFRSMLFPHSSLLQTPLEKQEILNWILSVYEQKSDSLNGKLMDVMISLPLLLGLLLIAMHHVLTQQVVRESHQICFGSIL